MEYKSLYDYLGKPAGRTLGSEIYKSAVKDNVPVQIKQVSNLKYTGGICMYPVEWLNKIFNKRKESNNTLPF